MPPLEELIRLAIRSAQPPLNDLLAIHNIHDFKELKAVGESYEATRLTLSLPTKK
jgi:hypothetical protein